MDWIDWIILPLIGAVGGFLAGLLGVGGGIIFVPLLTHYFTIMGFNSAEVVKFTLANSILLVFVSGVSGIVKQRKMGNWRWKEALGIGISGALVSVFLSYLVQRGDWYRKEDFQIVFLGFLIVSILNMLLSKKENTISKTNVPDVAKIKNRLRPLDVVVGFLAGSVVALSGLGGGVIMVPMFRMILKMGMKEATALSLSIIPMLSLFPLMHYLLNSPKIEPPVLHTGFLVWPVVLPIALGVSIFAGIGLKTASRVPVFYLRVIFAILSLIIFIKTIWEIIHS